MSEITKIILNTIQTGPAKSAQHTKQIKNQAGAERCQSQVKLFFNSPAAFQPKMLKPAPFIGVKFLVKCILKMVLASIILFRLGFHWLYFIRKMFLLHKISTISFISAWPRSKYYLTFSPKHLFSNTCQFELLQWVAKT